MTIVDLRHIIGQCDQIVETYCPVVIRCLQFLYMVNFVKIESIRLTVKSDLTVLIRYKNEFLHTAAKVNARILTEDLKLNTLKLFVRIVAINLYDLKTCLGALTFRCRAIRFYILDSLFLAVDADLVHDRLRAVSSDIGIIGDGHLGRIGDCVCRYSRSGSGFSSAQTIDDTLPGWICHNIDRTVINTQVCAQHIRHGHIRSFIQCRL